MDIGVRQETLITMPGQPVLVQLPLIPAYALTVHKTQALSIKHIVRGCIEGVFAQVKDCNMRVAFGKEGSKSVVHPYSMPSFFFPIFSTTTPM